jgi:hypothetical protein
MSWPAVNIVRALRVRYGSLLGTGGSLCDPEEVKVRSEWIRRPMLSQRGRCCRVQKMIGVPARDAEPPLSRFRRTRAFALSQGS